ncbi:MAG: hypothetical protein ACLP2Y_18935, partial [Limisphaerales bacterium]
MYLSQTQKALKKPIKSLVSDAKLYSGFFWNCVTQIGLYAFQALPDAFCLWQKSEKTGGIIWPP